ncbi:methyltransferase [Neptunomonas antarctica]|nr:methyltransferase [Neptunomonas antarctica]
MMSSDSACQAMLTSIDRPANGPLIDLGSGWGTLVIAVARKYPHQQVLGYELSWLPWLVSIIRKYSLRLDNLTLYRKDFKNAELSHASILFCYLFPEGMVTLHEKLDRELFNEILIVSNTFALPSCHPTKVIRLKDVYQTPIYVYHWQPKCTFTPQNNNDDKPYSKNARGHLCKDYYLYSARCRNEWR